MKKTVSVVLAGIGGYGDLYVKKLLSEMEAGRCTLVGIVEPVPERAPQIARIRAAGIPVYSKLSTFYTEQRADLCMIAAPTQFHTRLTVCAIMHGSHVLCEKPLAGDWRDGIALKALAEKYDKFLMYGFSWCYSRAVTDLKKDILAGRYGQPRHLSSLVLWPGWNSYFKRSPDFKGRRFADDDDTPIFDSVISNAASEEFCNMLYLLGSSPEASALPVTLDAELIRTNAIENFDTAVLRMYMEDGTLLSFAASHAVEHMHAPEFCYVFSDGVITCGGDTDYCIIGRFSDGSERVYGDPYADPTAGIQTALANAAEEDPLCRWLPCGIDAAMPHMKCVNALRLTDTVVVPKHLCTVYSGGADNRDTLRVINGLESALFTCFYDRTLLSEQTDAAHAVLRSCLLPEQGIPV